MGRGKKLVSPNQRAGRAVVAAFLAVGTSLALAQPAQAATKTIVSSRDTEAWYWSSNQDVRACTPPPFPGVCSSQNIVAAGPISPGHLGISWKNGSSDMRAYMLFDLSFIPIGSTLNSLVVTYTVSRTDSTNQAHTQEHAAAKPAATQNPSNSTIKIRGCIVKVAWGAVEGAPPQDRDPANPANTVPTEPAARNGVDETSCIQGKGTETTWTFDVTPFAQKWISGETFNNGFVLEPQGGATDNWTVELHGAYYANATTTPTGDTSTVVFVNKNEEAKAKVSYIPAVTPPPPPPPPPPPVTDGGSTGGGDPVTIPTTVPTTESTTTPAASPSPTNTPAATLPVAQPIQKTPWYIWLVLPLGIIGFVAVSRSLGREGGTETVNQVAEVLRRRHSSPGE